MKTTEWVRKALAGAFVVALAGSMLLANPMAATAATDPAPPVPGATLLAYEGMPEHNSDMFDSADRNDYVQASSLSPDGSIMVYQVAGQTPTVASVEVTWKTVDTATGKQLGSFVAPHLPDGRAIVWTRPGHTYTYIAPTFTSDGNGLGTPLLVVVDADSRTVTEYPVLDQPDGIAVDCWNNHGPFAFGISTPLASGGYRIGYTADGCNSYGSGAHDGSDIRFFDTGTGATTRVDIGTDPGNDESPALSSDGRYLGIVVSPAGIAGPENPSHVYRIDLTTGDRVRVDQAPANSGLPGDTGHIDGLVGSPDGSRYVWSQVIACNSTCRVPYSAFPNRWVSVEERVGDTKPVPMDYQYNPDFPCTMATGGGLTDDDCVEGSPVGFMDDNATVVEMSDSWYGASLVNMANLADSRRVNGFYVDADGDGTYSQARDFYNSTDYHDLGFTSAMPAPGVALTSGREVFRVRDQSGARSLWMMPVGESSAFVSQSATVIRPGGSVVLTAKGISQSSVGVFASPYGGTSITDADGTSGLSWAAQGAPNVVRVSPTQVRWTPSVANLAQTTGSDPIYLGDGSGLGPHTVYLAANDGRMYPFTVAIYPKPDQPTMLGGLMHGDTLTLDFGPPTQTWGDPLTGYALRCGSKAAEVGASARTISLDGLTTATSCTFAAEDGAGDGRSVSVAFTPGLGLGSGSGASTIHGAGSGTSAAVTSPVMPPHARVKVRGHKVTLTVPSGATGRVVGIIATYRRGAAFPASPTAGTKFGQTRSRTHLRIQRSLRPGRYAISVFAIRSDGVISTGRHLRVRVLR